MYQLPKGSLVVVPACACCWPGGFGSLCTHKTLLFLPLLRSKPLHWKRSLHCQQLLDQTLRLLLSCSSPLRVHGLCKANIWWPYPWNHKLNPTWCRKCNHPNKTGCFSSRPSITFCAKEISYVLGRTQSFWDFFENQFCGHCRLSAANSMRILPNLKYSLSSQWHVFFSWAFFHFTP